MYLFIAFMALTPLSSLTTVIIFSPIGCLRFLTEGFIKQEWYFVGNRVAQYYDCVRLSKSLPKVHLRPVRHWAGQGRSQYFAKHLKEKLF